MSSESIEAEAPIEACLVAHGAPDGAPPPAPHLVVVYAGETGRRLAAFAQACGYRTTFVEPEPTRAAAARSWGVAVVDDISEAGCDANTDVVATDHHREDLGLQLSGALRAPTRWIGVVGNPRLRGPHHELLAELGVEPAQIARVNRPIGLNIGSRTPPEIAISILAGLLADRSNRPGGFDFNN
jgi:xanthine dehydrogenase accessory factor